ncbi:MAG: ATP-binding protein [Chloroflexota bacterium]|nr:ATP-binding protein [Chloroflexota bacterium]
MSDVHHRPTEPFPAVPETGPQPTPAPGARPALAPSLPLQPDQPVAPPALSRRERARHWIRSGLASYRLRIVGWFILLLAVGTVATVLVVGYLLFQRIEEGIRSDLVRATEEFRAVATGNDPATDRPFGSDVERMFDVFVERTTPGRHQLIVTFLDGQLHERIPDSAQYPLERDPAFIALTAEATEVRSGRVESLAGAVDYVALPVRVDGVTRGVLAVAAFRDPLFAEQQDILLGAIAGGVILLLIGSILAWRLADRLLAPVSQTAATARAISETDLSQRVEVQGYDEVAQLARTFNEMLDRLTTAFADQRRFLDDVGHELRTPLTIVRGHLELLDEGTADERERTRDLVLDELERMTRLVNDLLVLAQASRPDFLHRHDVDARDLVQRVYEKAAVLGERSWRLEVGSNGAVSCDPQRITQAMLQLASNAVGHTETGDEIRVGGDVRVDEARFWVQDTGPGIADDEQHQIFRRFYRAGGQSRASGSGLGLSIVEAIAEAHGGRVEVNSNPGLGARFTVVVPR